MNKQDDINPDEYRKVCEEVATFHYCLTPINELQNIIDELVKTGKENGFPTKDRLIEMFFGYMPLDFLPKTHPKYKSTLLSKEINERWIKENKLWYDEPPSENTKKIKFASIKNFVILIKSSHSIETYLSIFYQIIGFTRPVNRNSELENILGPTVPKEKFRGEIFLMMQGGPPSLQPVENFRDGVIRLSERNPYAVYSIDKLVTIMENEKFVDKTIKRNSDKKSLDENDLIECLKDTKIIL